MQRAIEKVSDAKLQTARNGNRLSTRHSGTRCPFYWHSRSGKLDEVRRIASVQRQLKNPLVLDDLSNTCGACLHEPCIGLNLNRFRDLTYLQHRIDDRIAVDLQNDSRLDI